MKQLLDELDPAFLKLAECQHALDTKGSETAESHVGSFASNLKNLFCGLETGNCGINASGMHSAFFWHRGFERPSRKQRQQPVIRTLLALSLYSSLRCSPVWFSFQTCHLASRCVKILAAEHRYKLLAGELKKLPNKRPREEGHQAPPPSETSPGDEGNASKRPRGKAKAKSKA